MSINYYSAFQKWNMDIIHDSNGYRGIMSTDNTADFYMSSCETWREFSSEIRRLTGIRLPARKNLSFLRLSDCETIAGIDASHIRASGCIVTAKDRKNGWRRENIF